MSTFTEAAQERDRRDMAEAVADDREREGYAEQEALRRQRAEREAGGQEPGMPIPADQVESDFDEPRECVIGGCDRPDCFVCRMYQAVPRDPGDSDDCCDDDDPLALRDDPFYLWGSDE